MKEIKKYIKRNTKIYSLEHGVGEIVGFLKLHDGIQDYIEVKFYKKSGEVSLYPLDYKSDLRIISNPIELTGILKRLALKITDIDYVQSTRPHQRIGADVDLEFLISLIASLVGNLSLNLKERELLRNCVDSLILEVGHVFKINEDKAKGIVSDYMRAA